jgi:hypothetical protein
MGARSRTDQNGSGRIGIDGRFGPDARRWDQVVTMPFVPGVSGNPAGRPRGFAGVAKQIMSATREGAELVEFALGMMRDPKAKPAERLAAHAWLSDRALGRPVATLDANVTHDAAGIDLSKLSDAALAELATVAGDASQEDRGGDA